MTREVTGHGSGEADHPCRRRVMTRTKSRDIPDSRRRRERYETSRPAVRDEGACDRVGGDEGAHEIVGHGHGHGHDKVVAVVPKGAPSSDDTDARGQTVYGHGSRCCPNRRLDGIRVSDVDCVPVSSCSDGQPVPPPSLPTIHLIEHRHTRATCRQAARQGFADPCRTAGDNDVSHCGFTLIDLSVT